MSTANEANSEQQTANEANSKQQMVNKVLYKGKCNEFINVLYKTIFKS